MNFKTVGATFIVAGTSIGAGMLGIPYATSSLGVMPAILLLIAIWAVSIYSALLMLEINLRSGVGDNVHVITGKTLGPVGQFIQSISFLSLLLALTTLYLIGGADVLGRSLDYLGVDLNYLTSHLKSGVDLLTNNHNDLKQNDFFIILFGLLLGSLSFFGVVVVDHINRVLFSLMIVLLITVLVILIPYINHTALVETVSKPIPLKDSLGFAIPAVFTSFGFHVCIATLVKYLDGKTVDLRRAIIVGSTIPLVCYIIWVLSTLGVVGPNKVLALQSDSISPLFVLLQTVMHAPWMKNVLTAFAGLALITSFLGVTLALFDFLAELTRAKDTLMGRARTWLITFIPPLFLAMLFPKFYTLLAIAAVPLAIMIIFLPIGMALQQRSKTQSGYQVKGGSFALLLLALAGVLVIYAQIHDSYGALVAFKTWIASILSGLF